VTDLITASAGDPVLDVALSHALLREVAAGARGETVRVYRPGAAVAFGRLDALRPGFAAAAVEARAHGHTPLVRSVGGHAAPYDGGSLVLERFEPSSDMATGLHERFEAMAERLAAVLEALGFDARVGELPGEYCAGAHSINVGGTLKVAGIAQRAMRGGALTSAIVTVHGGAGLRAIVAAVYAALDLDVDPSVSGALDEAGPVEIEELAARLADAYAPLAVVAIDPALLAAAHALVPRHLIG
jgi:octanoyl-[GcvH]:protein N-octanoyltransferase